MYNDFFIKNRVFKEIVILWMNHSSENFFNKLVLDWTPTEIIIADDYNSPVTVIPMINVKQVQFVRNN